ncbi:putative inositol monophosphatase 3 isoform X1 [Bactrocera dorsalis]|uniref:inositol-phosphate phosphatase n=2 Tax=Bactrocera dorsalis TaxID=27457 RepID=A0A6J0RGE8_BACDO|nr:putative inositol monophosphatase 3 isoform X1 [Bactrocera dorsalis]
MSYTKRREKMGRTIHIHRVPAAIALITITLIIVYFVNFHADERPAVYGLLRNQNKVNLRKLLIGAIQAAQRGGLEVLDVAQSRDLRERSKGKTDEGANDPFTDADGRSHCVMKEGLHRIFPRVKIYSEEDKESCSNVNTFDLDPTVLHETANLPNELVDIKDVTVWIDPLDATQEFTEKLYQYVTTMVCVAVKGKPIIGVIHSPFIGQTAWAWVDHSMSEYLASIHPVNPDSSKPLITVSRSHAGSVKDLTRNVFGEESEILTAAGAGYKVLQVISNNATAYLHSTKIKKWDICAGDAILNALGGAMTNLNDELIDYGPEGSPVNDQGLLATLKNHDEYIEKLMEYRKSHTAPAHR